MRISKVSLAKLAAHSGVVDETETAVVEVPDQASARCCLATTPTTADYTTPAVQAPAWLTRS
jgi:hypothetical protein